MKKNDRLTIKIACLIVAIIMYIMIMVETNPLLEKSITNVNVTVKNISVLENSNLILMNPDKNNITISFKVKGYGENLNKLTKNDFSATIDLLGYKEGITNAKVEVIGPSGIEIENIYPSQIACNIESIISRVMDVTAQFEGTQEEGFHKLTPIVKPSSVKITGPRSVVNSATLAVATINIDKLNRDIAKTVPVRIYDGKNKEIFMSKPTDNVEVTVPMLPTKLLDLVPSILGKTAEGYQIVDISVEPKQIKVAANQDILQKIEKLNLEILDISEQTNSVLSSKKILNAEGLILLDEAQAPVVKIVIEKIVERELIYNLDEVKFINIKEGGKVKAINPNEQIKIVVRGTSTLIENLVKEDITLSANLKNAKEGQNIINIDLATEKKVNSIESSEKTILIEYSTIVQ